jgi:L-ribulose-5-phosphate 3-epimerase
MKIGYNTNGFAHHRLEDAIEILAELGYMSVALTLDHHALNPFDLDLPKNLYAVRRLLVDLNLRCVVETGARFLLDRKRKHQPTLLSENHEHQLKRYDFLCRAVDIAQYLKADAVSFWSGSGSDGQDDYGSMDVLSRACRRLCDYAAERDVRLAFEPEPGMFIDTMGRFAELQRRVDHPNFGLTIDIGHLHCLGELPISDHIRKWSHILWNIHIEDMRRGVHDHLMFGEGEIDFPPILRALEEIGYAGGVHVELSRHSYDAVNAARKSIEFLNKAISHAS